MSERAATINREINKDEVNETIRKFEDEFVTERMAKTAVLGAIFGEQLMEKHERAGMPVATGGPTWSKTGQTQDATDGDNEFHGF